MLAKQCFTRLLKVWRQTSRPNENHSLFCKMKEMRKLRLIRFAVLIGSITCLIGCNSNDKTEAVAKTTSADDKSVLVSKLQQADQLDGNEDHVIGKCYVCGLGMDGKAEHATEFQGYTAHLCSEMCCNHFKEHAEEVIEKTSIPKPKTK